MVNIRNPHDLSQVRPSQELDGPLRESSPARHASGRHPAGRQLRDRQPRPANRRGRHPRHRAEGAGLPSWAKPLAVFGAIVAFAAAAVVALITQFSPADLVRDELIRQVKLHTGRDLHIAGGAHVIFYPSLGVSLEDVKLSGPSGMAGGPALTADTIDLSVALLPLIERKVLIERVSIVRPKIDLRVDKTGRKSWELAALENHRPVRLAQLGGVPAAALPVESAGFLGKIELRSIRLTKATILYRDERSGAAERFDDLDVHVTGRRMSDPMQARGGFVWQSQPITFDANLDTLSEIAAGRAAKTRVTVAGQPVSVSFDGTVKLADAISLAGQMSLSGPSLAATARWLGVSLPNAAPLGGFTGSAWLITDPASAALNGASLTLGETRASGTLKMAFGGKRPALNAELNLSDVDLDRIAAGFRDAELLSRQPTVSASEPASVVKKSAPTSIEDLLRQSDVDPIRDATRFNSKVRGYTNRNEWSSEAIDPAILRILDADARVRIEGLKVAGLAIGRVVARVALSDGAARIDIDDLDLYEGTGKGVVTASPQADAITFGTNLRFEKIATKTLLSDAAGFERLDARGDLAIVMSGVGKSQQAIAESTKGTAEFKFRNGAVVGWDIAAILSSVQSGQLPAFEPDPSQKTEFSELAGSFKITQGVATTGDLRLVSALLGVAGDGTVGIAKRDIDLSLRPRLVTSTTGQFSSQEPAGRSSGLEIPVRLKGPWHAPRIVPDFGSLAKDPAQLIERAGELGSQFKEKLNGKSLGDVVRGALSETEDTSKPVDAIKNLLSR